MHHLEESPDQPAIAISWIGSHNLRATNRKKNALVFPVLSPQAGTGHNWFALYTCIFHYPIVTGTHHRMISAHQSPYPMQHKLIRWLICLAAKDHTAQLRNIFSIIRCRPAQYETIT